MKKHYIKVYWDDDMRELKKKLKENISEYKDGVWTYAQDMSDRFGGDNEKLPLMIISGKCFFILGAGIVQFDELIIGDPEDEDTWIHLHDVEFGDDSTAYELMSRISKDTGDYIPIYLECAIRVEDNYKFLEIGL